MELSRGTIVKRPNDAQAIPDETIGTVLGNKYGDEAGDATMIGIIMLDTGFPRVCGDIGNPASFRNPVIYECVGQATVERAVTSGTLSGSLEKQFVQAACALEQRGAKVIGTSCGFLAHLQESIQSGVNVPVLASSLLLIPTLRSLIGERTKIGVLTFDQDKLSTTHCTDLASDYIVVQSLPKEGELFQCISNDAPMLNQDAAAEDVLTSASQMFIHHPEIGLILIECTNISPYKDLLRETFNRPVFDLIDALEWVAGTLA